MEKDTETWENQIVNIEKAFDPYRKLLKMEITRDMVLKLCEKPVRKISKFDIKKAEEQLLSIETDIEEIRNHLEHLIGYTIRYFTELKKKYGKGKNVKRKFKNFDTIDATALPSLSKYMSIKKRAS